MTVCVCVSIHGESTSKALINPAIYGKFRPDDDEGVCIAKFCRSCCSHDAIDA